MIEGERIDLRPVRADDLELLRTWQQDERIAGWMGTRAAALDARETPQQEFERLLRMPRIKVLAIQTKAGATAGFIRLDDLDLAAGKAVVRLFVGPDLHGRGYGTDALRTLACFCFAELGLHRLGLVVREDNARARQVYERLGFVVEGRERDAIRSGGAWMSYIHMGLLAHELLAPEGPDAGQAGLGRERA